MKILLIVINLLFLISNQSFSQNQQKIDSLLNVFNTVDSDTEKTSILITITGICRHFDSEKALTYCEQAIALSKKINDKNRYYKAINLKGLINLRLGNSKQAISNFNTVINNADKNSREKAVSCLNLGNIYAETSKYDSCLIFYNKAQIIFNRINDKKSEATTLINIGSIYSDLGDYDKAILYYTKSKETFHKSGNLLGEAAAVENIGIIYYYQKNYNKALEYFKLSIKLFRKTNRLDKTGDVLNNIASLYLIMDDVESAIQNFKEAEDIYRQIGEQVGQAEVLQNLAQLYFKTKQYDQGIKALNNSISIFQRLGHKKSEGISYKALGSHYLKINDFRNAILNFNKALKILEPLGVKNDLKELYHSLAITNTKIKDFETATKYYEKYIAKNDSIYNAEKNKQIAEMQAKYDTEKKEQELKLKNIQYENEKLESKKKTIQRNYTMVGLGLMIILIIIVFISYKQKQKANRLLNKQKNEIIQKNEELNQQNEEIRSQRDEIELQKNKIEKIHHEVSQSIDYATRLQSAVLSDEKLLKKHVSDHFVLFKPKDKVSGDFYWWTHIENHTVIAVADCTGHGVPGAFMSMLGISFLREIVTKEYITHTGVILRKLRKEIIKTLKQTGESGTQKDGMDMAIISIDHETNILQYSGANNPLYIINPNRKEWPQEAIPFDKNLWAAEIKPNKMPIAIYEKMGNFTTHELQLQDGDKIYMFSDGYADQFGGEKGKKFKYKHFKHLLLENSEKQMAKQKEILSQVFDEWKGNAEQVDDVVVVGIKI